MQEAGPRKTGDLDGNERATSPIGGLRGRLRGSYVRALQGLTSRSAAGRTSDDGATERSGWGDEDDLPITEVPEIEGQAVRSVETYAVMEPYSYVRITYDKDISEYFLEVLEPRLEQDEERLLAAAKETMGRALRYEWDEPNASDKRDHLLRNFDSFARSRGYMISPLSRKRIGYYILRDFIGYGKTDVLMRDGNIEDISCDGVGVPLFVYHRKYGSMKTGLVFNDEEELNSYVVALGQKCGRQISVANPILDGTSPEGHRVQATYAREVTTRGSTFTVRRFRDHPFTPVDLIKNGTASPEMMAYFWLGVEFGSSTMVCGGTASGKTSTLNSIALFIPPGSKIVSMEDTREINLPHENWVPSTTRSGVGERGPKGKAPGEIDMYDLMRASLRQRPDYIIVGEVRGRETYTMFQAMATGHTTYSTMHADSMQSMVNRLENEPINCPRMLLTSLCNVIFQSQVRVGNDLARRMRQVIEIIGYEPDTNELISSTVFEWDQANDRFVFKGHSTLIDHIMEVRDLTYKEMMAEFDRRMDVVRYMVHHDITDHRRIWEIINRYSKDPEGVAERMRNELREEG